MVMKLPLARPRAHTTDAGAISATDGINDSPRPESARERSPHPNKNWAQNASREPRRKIVKAAPSYRQEFNSPEAESTSSLSRGSPLRLASVNESWCDQGLCTPSTASIARTNDSWADIPPTSSTGLDDEAQNKDFGSLKRKPIRNPRPVSRLRSQCKWSTLFTVESAAYIPDSQLFWREPKIPDARAWAMRSQSLPRHGELSDTSTDSKQINPTRLALWQETHTGQKQWEAWPQAHAHGLKGPTDEVAPTAPLLDVHIPEVEMERYSVMFGSFYDTTSNSKLAAPRSRNDLVPETMQLPMRNGAARPRRATSPAPKSPGFSLFPATHTNNASHHIEPHYISRDPVPLQKSHTMPASPDDAYVEIASRHKPPFQYPLETSESSDSVSYLSTAPSEIDDGFSDEDHETIKLCIKPPEQNEPMWEMVTPGPNPPRSTHETLQKLISKEPVLNATEIKTPLDSKPNLSNTLAPPPIPLPFQQSLHSARNTKNSGVTDSTSPGVSKTKSGQVDFHRYTSSINSDIDDFQTVEVSIAKSISVSKRKHILVPIGGKSSAFRSNERLVERRVATPTAEVLHKGHRYEKSRAAVLENA
ncbi:predicted protein [Uncinocarpus reesii 1704]|uniref:Uncharacterized protein n=1 Tax=Uncinocarpus reesii (strain UAMH 1704) TaxID=336963 RepID=C4JI58_UNCRE|nr:uncharacterized protein UREG_02804 [Uncinocarpus reesii 1704]EEP77955.1 predicted protein [Uncinocarpus reesii 1704]